jgi:hypothetical protein
MPTPSPAPVLSSNLVVRAGFGADDLAPGSRLCPLPPKTDFTASWIWVPEQSGYERRNSYAWFRRTFTASGDLTLHIAADSTYELHLDGALVDRGTAPAEVSYKTFDTHRLTVGPGRHVLAILVHHLGQQCATAMRSRPGLLVEMTSAGSDPVISDASWKVLPAAAYQQWLPCMMSHFGFYEVCDHAKVPAGWTTLACDDAAWSAAEVIGPAGCAPWSRLIPRDIPALATAIIAVERITSRGSYQTGPIAETEKEITVAVEMATRIRRPDPAVATALPLALAQGAASEFAVVDFGRVVTGHVRLEFTGAQAGQKVDIGYDEILDADGRPNPRRTYVHAADRAFLRAGQGELQIHGGRGFRFLLLDVAAGLGGLTLTRVAVAERTYPVARTGTFRSSDPELAHLYEVGLTTTRLCQLDSYVDCPSRERVMWMDMTVEAQCSVYGFGETALWRHCLYLFAQNPCREGATAGAIKGFAPCDYDPMLVSYTLYYLISVADFHHHSGDRPAAEALFPTVLKQLEVIARFTTPEGLINEKWPGWGTFLDWSAMDIGGVSSCNNAIYIRAHRETARLARALGMVDVARELEARAVSLAEAYRRAFWSADEGLFVDSLYDGKPSAVRSQLANVMAVWAGIVGEPEARALLAIIMDESRLLPMTSCNHRLKPGFTCQTGGLVRIGTPGSGFLLVQVLFEFGLARKALAYLKANWLPITRGGTYAEHFANDYDISYCHGWGAGAVVQLPAYVLGIRPVAPGWREIEIRPQCAGLDWAEGTVPTPHGDITVAWRKVGGEPKLEYQVPPGIKVVQAAFR